MQAIPVPVKNVTVYKCFNPIEPLTEVVIKGGSGTYAVGTLATNIFYNLDLNSGDRVNPLVLHEKYYATGETMDGQSFTTPCMYCLNNSDSPQFGITVSMLHRDGDTDHSGGFPTKIDSSEYIKLGALTNVTVSQSFTPPAIGQTILIENGTGNIIATKIGTPHLMGVEVDSGDYVGQLHAGMKNILISGTTEQGTLYTQNYLTVISAGKPSIFLRELQL